MRVRSSSEARRDRRQAEAYYQSISPHVRWKFQRDLQTALHYLTSHPLGAPVRFEEVRAKRLLHFPYTIFYRAHDRHVFILVIAHQARHPDDDFSRF